MDKKFHPTGSLKRKYSFSPLTKKPFISGIEKTKRLNWALERIELGEEFYEYSIASTIKHNDSRMFWSCFSWEGLNPIIQLVGAVKQECTNKTLEFYAIPTLEAHARQCKKKPAFKRIMQLPRISSLLSVSPQTPDINPIENTWPMVESGLRKHYPAFRRFERSCKMEINSKDPHKHVPDLLPEILDQIFEDFRTNDPKSLYRFLFVCRSWAKRVIPILWKNPFRYIGSLRGRENILLESYLLGLKHKEFEELKVKYPALNKYSKSRQSPIFNYASYLKEMDMKQLQLVIQGWLYTQTQSNQLEDSTQRSECTKILSLIMQEFFAETVGLNKLFLTLEKGINAEIPDFVTFPGIAESISHIRHFECSAANGSLSEIENPRLNSLLILMSKTCKDISRISIDFGVDYEKFPKSVGSLISSQRGLKILKIRNFSYLDQPALNALSSQSKYLTRLEFHQPLFAGVDLTPLAHLKKLGTLVIIEAEEHLIEYSQGYQYISPTYKPVEWKNDIRSPYLWSSLQNSLFKLKYLFLQGWRNDQNLGTPLFEKACGEHLTDLVLKFEASSELLLNIGRCCQNIVSLAAEVTSKNANALCDSIKMMPKINQIQIQELEQWDWNMHFAGSNFESLAKSLPQSCRYLCLSLYHLKAEEVTALLKNLRFPLFCLGIILKSGCFFSSHLLPLVKFAEANPGMLNEVSLLTNWKSNNQHCLGNELFAKAETLINFTIIEDFDYLESLGKRF
ncbi:hypothetical protein G9A89_001853 [Geosiphon pyriformis]|nr:hypothetical protein G9A89_001853 [Geosiphon pyriformis]